MGDSLKRAAAAAAVELVRDGMLLGLGTGSTADHALELLGERVADGLAITGVPTSERTAARARELGIPLRPFEPGMRLDLAIDGADEVSPQLELIKGLGGALLREKRVESCAEQLVIIIDDSKLVARLGRGPLPVEVAPAEADATLVVLRALGCEAELRQAAGTVFVTDNGNWIAHLRFARGIPEPTALDARLQALPGVIDTGLFLGMADIVYSAGPAGVQRLRRAP
ncbi:MAG: ribose-5-phosphate isomerase RpiA [Candidatus Poseidoniia archaeon]|mgnify:CR=1 FL=1|nr:ribose-5-phosphate isomerase RpiA [Candidatus Poseidoniia archaeon]MDP6847113.1 ribose-5-phosphate isomerase RpiA [Candidatus Poseidoniia archaeon]MDP7007770.1 ribose-5-phosphate isomerase RpiA [Candidatus Poseidoniia archaeon]